MKAEFTAVFRKEGAWIAAYVEEIPGVNAQGRTKREARTNLRDALKLVLLANAELARRQNGVSLSKESMAIEIEE